MNAKSKFVSGATFSGWVASLAAAVRLANGREASVHAPCSCNCGDPAALASWRIASGKVQRIA